MAMHTQINSAKVFLDKAVKTGAVVRVTRGHTSVPKTVGRDVYFVPAQTAYYKMEFDDPTWGASVWHFQECVVVEDADAWDSGTRVAPVDALLASLREAVPQNVRMVHRSGSID